MHLRWLDSCFWQRKSSAEETSAHPKSQAPMSAAEIVGKVRANASFAPSTRRMALPRSALWHSTPREIFMLRLKRAELTGNSRSSSWCYLLPLHGLNACSATSRGGNDGANPSAGVTLPSTARLVGTTAGGGSSQSARPSKWASARRPGHIWLMLSTGFRRILGLFSRATADWRYSLRG